MIMHYVQAQEIYEMKSVFRFSQKKVVDTFVDAFLGGLKESRE
jgi:hypothetical protein